MLCNQNMACNKAQSHNRWCKSPAAGHGTRSLYKDEKIRLWFLDFLEILFPPYMVSRNKQIVPRRAAGALCPRRFWWKPRCSGEKRERETSVILGCGCPLAQERFSVWLTDAAGHRDAQSAVCSSGLKGSLGTSGSLEPHKQESSSVSPHAGAAPITFCLFCATGNPFYISQTLQLLLSAEPQESGDFKAARQGFFSLQC